jgi:hypothetical protein
MTVQLKERVTRAAYDRELDFALAASFPASDPLPWTLGVAVPHEVARVDRIPRPRAAATDVIVESRTPGLRRLASVAEAFALAALVPVAILLIGLPIVAAIRATAAVVARLGF